MSSSSGDETGETKENAIEYYLIRVPKHINVKELNGTQIDLDAFGPSENVIVSKGDPDQSYGYDLISPKQTSFNSLTRLKTTTTTTDDDDDDDTNKIYQQNTLKGCINFYVHKPQPELELTPLVPPCPNDSIEDIVNRARGHSVKRKSISPIRVKGEKSPIKKHKAR